MKEFVSRFFLMLCMSVLPLSVQSMAVSDADLNSYLNQPLNARINISSASQEELQSLRVLLTEISDEAINQSSPQLTYEIVDSNEGPYISISSREVIREPYVAFSLELIWSSGRLIREYTLIIDPQ